MNDQIGLIPKNPIESLLYSTVQISVKLSDENISTGTGFFFRYSINENKCCDVILTNKHVVEDAISISFCFHQAIKNKDGNAMPGRNSFSIDLYLKDFKNLWVPHPNPNVDLGAIFFEPIRSIVLNNFQVEIFWACFDSTLIYSDTDLKSGVGVAEKLLMIGYPNGLFDQINNFPIIRQGISSTHPSLDFNNEPIGVADIACFPGSSGSPIIYCPEVRYVSGGGIVMGPPTYILLGLLYAGPAYTSEGRIEIKEIPTATETLATFNTQMIHLGYYVKAKEILVLWDSIEPKINNSTVPNEK